MEPAGEGPTQVGSLSNPRRSDVKFIVVVRRRRTHDYESAPALGPTFCSRCGSPSRSTVNHRGGSLAP